MTTPGIEEPDVQVCVFSGDVFICPDRDLPPLDGIGYQCLSPEDHAKVLNHHDALHEELNKK